MKEEYKLYVFNSTHHALKAEQVLKENGYQLLMVPIPIEITADCGTAIKLEVESEQGVYNLLSEAKIEVAGCYQVVKDDFEKRIIKLGLDK
ncbi:DUF3343 domain-containing protein [Natroniella sulfidigena]|uniref:DUF3343 domain-containing protein n=1 Tax=Natroniella sulfidigena TaxID=723921 RepID=UPI00200AC0B5|nr:DUF3343 domain-containing protein [Natroniella sulfidigena]MCK8816736.1 DUF3343 domain-containing protein [Natroniella sulfidigena]